MAETTVTVRGLQGDVIFGPEALARATVVAEVRRRLLEAHPRQLVTLIKDAGTLDDGHVIDEDELCITATFAPALSEEDRAACLAKIEAVPRELSWDEESTDYDERVTKELDGFTAAALDDPAVMNVAVQKTGFALMNASKALQGDRDLVLKAVRHRGWMLACVSAELRNDEEVVMDAVCGDEHALKHASERLRSDRDFLSKLCKTEPGALEYVCDELRKDKDFVKIAMQADGYALFNAADLLHEDEELFLLALTTCGNGMHKIIMHRLPEELKSDADFMAKAEKLLPEGWDESDDEDACSDGTE